MTKPSQKIQFGYCSMYPAPGILERVGADWDWIWIDGQHGQHGGYQEILSMVRACNLVGTKAFVRVPSHEVSGISLALDMNADGVIVPQIDTVDQALAVVRAAKFPPTGNRSYGGRRPIDFLGRNYSDTANHDKKLLIQIESEEALDNADALAAVAGVDGLFLGPDDMMLRKGFKMDAPRDMGIMTECVRIFADACRKHGKTACTVAMDKDMIQICVGLGVEMIVAGGDVPFLANTSKEVSKAVRAIAHEILANGASDPASGNLEPKSLY